MLCCGREFRSCGSDQRAMKTDERLRSPPLDPFALHTPVTGRSCLLEERKKHKLKNFQYKSSNMGVHRRFPKGDRKALWSRPQTRNPLQYKYTLPCLKLKQSSVNNRFFHGILGEEQLGGASADAQSYWQGRFAACAFVGDFLGFGRTRNSRGVAPNPTRDAVPCPCKGQLPLDPARGNCPLTPFRD